MRASTGLYIEIRMKADMESVWRLTQNQASINGGTCGSPESSTCPRPVRKTYSVLFTRHGLVLAWLFVELGRASRLA